MQTTLRNSKEEFSVADYLTKFSKSQKNSKEFQGYGWGCVICKVANGSITKCKSIWEMIYSVGSSTRLIAHARSAFKDEGIVVENNMPFYEDKYILFLTDKPTGEIKEEGRIMPRKYLIISNDLTKVHQRCWKREPRSSKEIKFHTR